MLAVRPAWAPDLAAIYAMAAAGRQEVAPEAPADALAWAQLMLSLNGLPATILLLLECDGATAGFAAATVVDGLAGISEGSVADLYVLPALRRRGAGSALLSAAEAVLRAWGCPSATALVPAGSPAAEALARRHGYDRERVILARRLTAGAGRPIGR